MPLDCLCTVLNDCFVSRLCGSVGPWNVRNRTVVVVQKWIQVFLSAIHVEIFHTYSVIVDCFSTCYHSLLFSSSPFDSIDTTSRVQYTAKDSLTTCLLGHTFTRYSSRTTDKCIVQDLD